MRGPERHFCGPPSSRSLKLVIPKNVKEFICYSHPSLEQLTQMSVIDRIEEFSNIDLHDPAAPRRHCGEQPFRHRLKRHGQTAAEPPADACHPAGLPTSIAIDSRGGCVSDGAADVPAEPSSRLAARAIHSHKHLMNNDKLDSRPRRATSMLGSAMRIAKSYSSGSASSPVPKVPIGRQSSGSRSSGWSRKDSRSAQPWLISSRG